MKKKWNLFLLVLAVILFILLMIPFFQNLQMSPMVYFFKKGMSTFTSIYMPFMALSMLEWSIITLYVISLLKDLNRQDATKFDLKE